MKWDQRASTPGSGSREKTFIIDSFPDSVVRYASDYALACVDVFNSSTTIATAVARGRRTFIANSRSHAFSLARRFEDALLAGEEFGAKPQGFHVLDSPSALDERTDLTKPLVIYSTPGTEILVESQKLGRSAYVCCLRNLTATAEALAANEDRVAIIGAGGASEFNCEDQLACARLAKLLSDAGFVPGNLRTHELIERWCAVDVSIISWGNGAAHLRSANRQKDVAFALDRVDDLPFACRYENEEVAISPAIDAQPLSPVAEPTSTPSVVAGVPRPI